MDPPDIAWVVELDPAELVQVDGLQGRWRRWLAPIGDETGLILGMGELAAGETAGWHSHPEPEAFFVLMGRGEARWRLGDRVEHAELVPGWAFYKSADVPHQMVNLGSEPLRGLFIKLGHG